MALKQEHWRLTDIQWAQIESLLRAKREDGRTVY